MSILFPSGVWLWSKRQILYSIFSASLLRLDSTFVIISCDGQLQIAAICQEAGMHAVRKNRYVILPKDFEKGYRTNVKKPDTDFEFYKWFPELEVKFEYCIVDIIVIIDSFPSTISESWITATVRSSSFAHRIELWVGIFLVSHSVLLLWPELLCFGITFRMLVSDIAQTWIVFYFTYPKHWKGCLTTQQI